MVTGALRSRIYLVAGQDERANQDDRAGRRGREHEVGPWLLKCNRYRQGNWDYYHVIYSGFHGRVNGGGRGDRRGVESMIVTWASGVAYGSVNCPQVCRYFASDGDANGDGRSVPQGVFNVFANEGCFNPYRSSNDREGGGRRVRLSVEGRLLYRQRFASHDARGRRGRRGRNGPAFLLAQRQLDVFSINGRRGSEELSPNEGGDVINRCRWYVTFTGRGFVRFLYSALSITDFCLFRFYPVVALRIRLCRNFISAQRANARRYFRTVRTLTFFFLFVKRYHVKAYVKGRLFEGRRRMSGPHGNGRCARLPWFGRHRSFVAHLGGRTICRRVNEDAGRHAGATRGHSVEGEGGGLNDKGVGDLYPAFSGEDGCCCCEDIVRGDQCGDGDKGRAGLYLGGDDFACKGRFLSRLPRNPQLTGAFTCRGGRNGNSRSFVAGSFRRLFQAGSAHAGGRCRGQGGRRAQARLVRCGDGRRSRW